MAKSEPITLAADGPEAMAVELKRVGSWRFKISSWLGQPRTRTLELHGEVGRPERMHGQTVTFLGSVTFWLTVLWARGNRFCGTFYDGRDTRAVTGVLERMDWGDMVLEMQTAA